MPQRSRKPALRRSRRRCAPALTLLELVAVLVIVAVALAAAAPSLRNFAEGRQTAHAARSFISLANWARTQSVSEGRLYRLHVDRETGSYWLTAETAGAFERLETPLGRTHDLPDRVTAGWQTPEEVRRLGYVTFEPTGRLTPATLQLEEPSGRRVTIRAATPSDRFAIIDTPFEGATP